MFVSSEWMYKTTQGGVHNWMNAMPESIINSQWVFDNWKSVCCILLSVSGIMMTV